MVYIKEIKTQHVVGEYSLLISFNKVSEYINFIKSLGGCYYHHKTKQWEVPIVYLSDVIDFFCQYEDIELEGIEEGELNIPQYNCDIDIDTAEYKLPPFDFQVDAIKYGLSNDKWLLLDPPGLGKTAVIIHLVEELIKRKELQHCLVICGLNSLKQNWKKEIEKHSNLTCRILGQRQTRNGTLVTESISKRVEELSKNIDETFVITNIETIRNDDIVELIENGPNKFDLIVCDEIHVVKNSTSQQGANFLKLVKHKRKIGATGTLLMNSPLDAYVPLRWIGAEKANLTTFKSFYCETRGPIFLYYKHTDVLKEMIKKHSLRRSKDLLNLPPLTIVDEYVEMDSTQAKLYEEVKSGIRDEVDKVVLHKGNILALLSRLRQVTACPSVLTTKNISCAKIDRCCDLVNQIVSGGEKVLIFSTFKETVNILAERLKEYNPLIGTGEINDDILSQNIDAFQTEEKHKCFIGTWQRCGTGITLTAATYVIFIDTAWNFALFEQHYSRAYRTGTDKNVTVYVLITQGTVDELVRYIVNKKNVISSYMIDNNEDTINDYELEILQKYIKEL